MKEHMDRLAIEMGIDKIEKNKDLFKRQYNVNAELIFSYFSSLQDKGFTEEQALEIAIAHGVTGGQ